MSFDTAKETNQMLSDEALDGVVGGLNPQPLPPGELFSIRSLAGISHFVLPQSFAAASLFRFR